MKVKCNPILAGYFILLLFFINACSSPQKIVEERVPSLDFAPYISAYTGGVIPKNAPIQIEFAQSLSGIQLNKPLEKNPFKFTPNIKGEAQWISANTLEFVPSEDLKSGEHYIVDLDLKPFLSVSDELRTFPFSFKVIEQLFTLTVNPIRIVKADTENVEVSGTLLFSDIQEIPAESSLFTAKLNGKDNVNVSLTNVNANTYRFQLAGVKRNKEKQKLEIIVDGKSIGVNQTEKEEFVIPALDSFELLSVQPIHQPESGFVLIFSEPVSTKQNLDGLIMLSDVNSQTVQVDQNVVNIYYDPTQEDSYNLTVYKEIKSYSGENLKADETFVIKAQKQNPAV